MPHLSTSTIESPPRPPSRPPRQSSAVRAFLLAPAVTVVVVMAAGFNPPDDVQHNDLLTDFTMPHYEQQQPER
jgi:hypothetical protein